MRKYTLYKISTFLLIAMLVGLFVNGVRLKDFKTTKAQSTAPNDSLRYALELTQLAPEPSISGPSPYEASEYIDLNGDGMVDFLYYITGQFSIWGNIGGLYKVYKNNGDNTFSKVYNCQWSSNSGGKVDNASGDCANLMDKTLPIDFFADYKTWKTGPLKSNDITREILNQMHKTEVDPNAPLRASQFIDINSDGLVDIVFSQTGFGASPQRYAILINNGNFTFTTQYKCYGWESYYGDCVGP